ncbi:hypothetical protein [Actinocatenispora rupis]|uniref:Uncharacterized protein n=1 Tax=Actinocatenispora rupis TaxID=519421 RepID=A0A8J3JEV5_9ACTN|nr:hypothetical protein [Actinocatenispora rupis]GID13578.1 hypothetical protein Aru02nite_44670 [Actinocatenispora rupis]
MTTEYGRTVVDVHSLADFTTALDNHHSAIASMLKTIDDKLLDVPPKLGGFPDATDTESYYASMVSDYRARVQRLRSAVEAARKATTSILDTYATAEARNHANSRDIARTMGPVGTALKGS